MKKLIFLIVFVCLQVFAGNGHASQWKNPDKGWFSVQKDIDPTVSNSSFTAALVNYEGKLYHFINYWQGDWPKIILRRLSNNRTDGINWSFEKEDNIDNLHYRDLYPSYWQPAAVVFNGALYLFVKAKDGNLAYSVYNSATRGWSALVKPFTYSGPWCSGAVVINDKLCLTMLNASGGLDVYWTKDLTTWHNASFNLSIYHDYNLLKSMSDDPLGIISAIAKPFMENSTLKVKIMVGYLDPNQYARCAELRFDASENLYLADDLGISSEVQYRSISLAEGSVNQDPGGGNLTQAFLKVDAYEANYLRCRILRFQRSTGAWTKQENNLVKLNYHWAAKRMNLTSVSYPMMEGSNIRTYICLVYMGYDDGNHPLNCAYAKSDYLAYIRDTALAPTDVRNTQYIGYIEGVPPYYLNDKHGRQGEEAYITPLAQAISELEFSSASTSGASKDIHVEVGTKVGGHFAGVKYELSLLYGKKWGSGLETTLTQKFSYAAKEVVGDSGKFIVVRPIFNRAIYHVYDAKNTFLYPTVHIGMKEARLGFEKVPLKNGLVSGNPQTYKNRNIRFEDYHQFGHVQVYWDPTNDYSYGSIAVKADSSITNTTKVSMEMGFAIGEIIESSVEGSFEYEVTTKYSQENEIAAICRLNTPKDPGDYWYLDYNVWWIKNTPGKNNWWLHEGQDPNQATWCITYEVYPSGPITGIHSDYPSMPNCTALDQNYPNPFGNVTRIRYTVDKAGTEQGNADPVRIRIFSPNGAIIKTLVEERQAPGRYEIPWDATGIAPGVYYCSFENGTIRNVKKIVKY